MHDLVRNSIDGEESYIGFTYMWRLCIKLDRLKPMSVMSLRSLSMWAIRSRYVTGDA